jgi:sulfide:quinone oxidoreductase
VAPQITAGEFAEIAAAGFRSVINNRPDGEAPDQLTDASARAAAAAVGLSYVAIPVTGSPGKAEAASTARALKELPGPVLAYCRSGTRSITCWALAQADGGAQADEVLGQARAAGYDLSGLRPAFGAGAR